MYPGMKTYNSNSVGSGGYEEQPTNPYSYNSYSISNGYNASVVFNFIRPEIQQWFNSVDQDHSGHINFKELQAALINFQGKAFSDTACKLMIAIFDQNKSGTIDIREFQQLFDFVQLWIGVFHLYDRDQSSSINENELFQAFQQMGYRFSPEFIRALVYKYDNENHAQITVDQFIVMCVQMQQVTESFKLYDTQYNGVISINYEDFLRIALRWRI